MHQILLVEDLPEFQKIIIATLTHHRVVCASTAQEAAEALQINDFDLILLDITLPDRDGYSILSELQSDTKNATIPVICLTGKTEVTDKVTAFSLGADDYIVKPFDPIELRARVEAKLKKSSRSKNDLPIRIVGAIEIDQIRRRVTVVDEGVSKEVTLTQSEFKLLAHFATHPEQALSRRQLLTAAWGENTNVLERVVDVHLCSLRKKLGSQSALIKALPGVGYKFVPNSPTKKRVS